jgi:hypothetical protein
MSNKDNSQTAIIIGPARFSFLNVTKPKPNQSGKLKYSVSLLIPKKDKEQKARIDAAVNAAIAAGQSKLKGVKPAKLKLPLRDGDDDREKYPEYAGHWFVNATSDQQPGIVDKNRQAIIDESEIYSGMFGRASVNFYAFDTNGNRGIACGLNNLQKLKDGEKLTSRKDAEDDFDDEFVFADDEDDENDPMLD